MKTYLKKLSAVMLVLLVFVTAAASVSAGGSTDPQTVGQSKVYMHDLADLLSNREEAQLIDSIRKYCDKVQYNVLFLTTEDAQGKTTLVYSDDYMDELFPMEEDNIAFVIDMDNRQIYINTMGSAITYLSDSSISRALDLGYSKIQNDDYTGCMQSMAAECMRILSSPTERREIPTFFSVFKIALLKVAVFAAGIAAVVFALLLSKHRKANRTPTATVYNSNSDYQVTDQDAIFVRRYETVSKDFYKENSSHSSGGRSSGGGGGSSHTSSSGRSHGGGGRSF